MYLEIKGLSKSYGSKCIIEDIDITMDKGELLCLLGASGSGKSTILKAIGGFIEIDKGSIYLDNDKISDKDAQDREVSTVFQSYGLFPHMSVIENIAYGLKFKGIKKKERLEKAEEFLDIIKLSGSGSKKISELSGGEQQRVALARAIVIHPEVLLMDEPLSNLDAKLRVEMRNAIKRIQQQIGITTVYVTHDQEEALAVSDRIAVMSGGVIQQIDTPKRIYQRPSNTFVATFIGQSNILDGQVIKNNSEEGIKIFDAFFAMTNLSKNCTNMEDVKVSIRPEEFILSMDNKDGIKGVVKSSVFLGINTNYFIELENGKEVEVIQASDALEAIPDGSTVYLNLQTEKINVFTNDGTKNLIKGV